MKKTLFFLFLIVAHLSVWAQDDEKKPWIMPGKGHINVEQLGKSINYDMDISQLSLAELRLLRNAVPARYGYVFNSSDLRSIFMTTSWYFERAYKRFEGKAKPIKYTPKEVAFMDRIKKREAELKAANYKPKGGGIVNTDNVINLCQFSNMPSAVLQTVNRQGFGIVRADHDQLFQVYEGNQYGQLPSFVTTDVYLQLFHLYFDTTLRKVEEETLSASISQLCDQMYQRMAQLAKQSQGQLKDAAEWNQAYFAVAKALISNKPLADVPAAYKEMAEKELRDAMEAEDNYSQFMGYNKVKFAYSLFRPRGHYTRSEASKQYFRAMMWLQTVPFGTDNNSQMLRAAIISEQLAAVQQAYDRVDKPITFLMGAPDNVTIGQLRDIMAECNTTAAQMAADDAAITRVADRVNVLGEKQIRIRPYFERTSRIKINFMPQRYTPDAEVLLKTVDYYNEPTKREVPMGLDFMAARGVQAADRILHGELNVMGQWDGYDTYLNQMKQRMQEIDWYGTFYTQWEQALHKLCMARDQRMPYFMKTTQWEKKNLNTALASWAELKHDAILYAKQPFGAECGGGDDLPTPVTVALVEPNEDFWQAAVDIMNTLDKVFTNYRLHTTETKELAAYMKEEAQFLLAATKKELAGKRLSDKEYERIRLMGSEYEDQSLKMLKEGDEELSGWYQVENADKKVAVVADVYTANADNNPEKKILYEAVGLADEIYVVVEVDGLLYLMRGGVFSYREFTRPMGEPRMTDEEWQQRLEQMPRMGEPSWMEEIIVPTDTKPEVDGTTFYSSEC